MADNVLDILVKLGVIGKEDVQAVNQLLEETKGKTGELTESTEGLNEQMEYLPDNLKNVGDAAEESGEKINTMRMKHTALRTVAEEINKLFPGLGRTFEMLGESAMKAGEGAEAAGTGMKGFAAGMEAVMASMLPFLAAMIVIQDAMKIWDLYKDKIKEVQEAQENANKAMVEANDKLIASTKALDEALHPTKNDTEKDQKALEAKESAIKEQFERQKELNKADEERELAAATNDKQKSEIKDRYRQKDQNLGFDESRALAGAEQSAANIANQQIAVIRAREAQLQATADANNAQLQADADKKTQAGDLKGAAIDKDAMASNASWLSGQLKNLKEKAGGLGEFSEDSADKARSGMQAATTKYQTQTAVADEGKYSAQESALLAAKDSHGETMKELLVATHKTLQQQEEIMREIISGHLKTQNVMASLHSQLGNTQNYQGMAGQ